MSLCTVGQTIAVHLARERNACERVSERCMGCKQVARTDMF